LIGRFSATFITFDHRSSAAFRSQTALKNMVESRENLDVNTEGVISNDVLLDHPTQPIADARIVCFEHDG
jgi:hypothetical protein